VNDKPSRSRVGAVELEVLAILDETAAGFDDFLQAHADILGCPNGAWQYLSVNRP
jgi:hypothetical protein